MLIRDSLCDGRDEGVQYFINVVVLFGRRLDIDTVTEKFGTVLGAALRDFARL